MNILKIQQELIKDVLNDKKSPDWYIEIVNDEVLITEGHVIYIIPANEFMLHPDKLQEKGVKMINIDTMLKNYKEAQCAERTGKLLQLKNGTVIELKCGEELIYINPKLIKHFDKDCEFEGTTYKAPVYIYEENELVGVVSPVNIRL